ncbi:MAG: hypothetical protein IJ845_08420 [Bacteroidaceae bacterium]|nr:hypothetical protein [Bacteroidaceae bacterium]
MDTEKFLLLAISILLAFAVGCWGRTRKIGFGWAFALSLLNVVIGIIAVACSPKIKNENDY